MTHEERVARVKAGMQADAEDFRANWDTRLLDALCCLFQSTSLGVALGMALVLLWLSNV